MSEKGSSLIIFILGVLTVSGIIVGGSLYIKNKKPNLLSNGESNKQINSVAPRPLTNNSEAQSQPVNSSIGKQIIYKNVNFVLPTASIDSQQDRTNGLVVKYNQDKVVTIIFVSPDLLLRVRDLSLDNNSFLAKYKNTTNAEIALQKQVIEKLSGSYNRDIATEINTQDKLKIIKRLFLNFEGHNYSVVEHNRQTFILDKTTSLLSIALEDKSGNYYQFLIKDNQSTLNNIISTLQVN